MHSQREKLDARLSTEYRAGYQMFSLVHECNFDIDI